MSDKHERHQNEPSKEDIRSAKKGWALIATIFASLFGAAYIMAEI